MIRDVRPEELQRAIIAISKMVNEMPPDGERNLVILIGSVSEKRGKLQCITRSRLIKDTPGMKMTPEINEALDKAHDAVCDLVDAISFEFDNMVRRGEIE